MVPEKSEENLQITSEEVVMTVNNKFVVHESITIDDQFFQMKQNSVYIIFLLMIMSERMFIIVGTFLFGYCLGYYSLEFMKSKNRKHEIHEFFLKLQ